MSRREKKNINNYPNYVDKYREVTSVLRDNEGYMVFSEIIDKKVFYRKTNVKDINISPNETGRRRFRRNIHLSILKKNIIEENYQGELFMYCLHSLKQDLLLVSEFSFNKSYPHLIVNEYGQSIQPFCKESKKIFVNENSNKKRTSDQHVEGSQGSRTRGLVTALCYGENVPTGEELFKKFGVELFIGKNTYNSNFVITNDNFFSLINDSNNINAQIKENISLSDDLHCITKDFCLYVKKNYYDNNDNKNKIVNCNLFKERYVQNNDLFLYVSTEEYVDSNNFKNVKEYYIETIKKIAYDKIYISSKNINHEICKTIITNRVTKTFFF
jgi:hypothetical protein